MDPLTITSTVIGISSHCIQTAKAISGLRDKYKNAGMMITAIYTELTVVSASLGHIQGLVSRDPASLQSSLQSRPELHETIDQALTGCVLIFSVLDDEVQKLYEGANMVVGRAAYIWKEDTMKDLLQQIRGQQTALTLLIQAFQMTSVADIKTLLQNNNVILEQVVQRSQRLRQAHPKIRGAPSVFEAFMDDAASISTYNSTASSTNFSFDNFLVNAQAYRRALAATRNDSSRRVSAAEDSGERSDDATIVQPSASISKNEDSYSKIFGNALSTKDSAVFRVKKSLDSSQDEPRFECQDMTDNWTELTEIYTDLKEKYNKVKKYYFEKEAQVHQVQNLLADERSNRENVQAERAKEKAWLESRLEGLENTKAFLLKKIQDLEQLDEEHKRYFQRDEVIRTDLNEKHRALISEKDDRISDLQDRLERSREETKLESQRATRQIFDSTTASKERISSLESDLESARLSLADGNKRIDQLKNEIAAKNVELERYKGFGAIIDQLRALSPASSTVISNQASPS